MGHTQHSHHHHHDDDERQLQLAKHECNTATCDIMSAVLFMQHAWHVQLCNYITVSCCRESQWLSSS
jgi:hypothetical protein